MWWTSSQRIEAVATEAELAIVVEMLRRLVYRGQEGELCFALRHHRELYHT